VDFWKILVGFCAFLEVPHIILCIFGSSSWDFVHFWKLPKCAQSHEELSNMHNPMRNFQKCKKSHEDLPKVSKIP
jgi:hypothetical protein